MAVRRLEWCPLSASEERNTQRRAVVLYLRDPQEPGDYARYGHKQRFRWDQHALPQLLHQTHLTTASRTGSPSVHHKKPSRTLQEESRRDRRRSAIARTERNSIVRCWGGLAPGTSRASPARDHPHEQSRRSIARPTELDTSLVEIQSHHDLRALDRTHLCVAKTLRPAWPSNGHL